MRALAREGGVLLHVGFKRRDEHSGVDDCGSRMGPAEFDRWVSEMGGPGWEDVKLDLTRRRRRMRKKEQRRMSLRLMENWVLDFMVLDGPEFCFGEKERQREYI
jgi:hypothetical protein